MGYRDMIDEFDENFEVNSLVETMKMVLDIDQLTNYCHLQGWEIFQNYVDPGFTGKDGNRPALKRMLADAKLGFFNRVLVTKLDRLSRNLRLLLEIEENLKQSRISVSSIKESIDTSTALGRTVFQVLGVSAFN